VAQLYGQSHNAASLSLRTGSMQQFGGVRLVTLGNGVERDMRMLQFNTGSGLCFSVLIDRAMDISEVTHKGRPAGWHSPTGFRHPGLHDVEAEQGFSWVRSFSGFLSTCGLDHVLGPEEVPADNYNYPYRKSVKHGIHGRIGSIPAQLLGYGETWQGDRCVLWAEGLINQSAVFGEVLHLHRRIEADLGGDEIRLIDCVINAGYNPTPHMLLYHVNLGYPVIDDGARYLAPIREVLWASHEPQGLDHQAVGYRTCPAPQMGFTEQVWQYDMMADKDGKVRVAVVNDRIGFGIEVETLKEQLPCALQWQNFQTGHYVMGIEPLTHHVKGNLFARERGEMIWLNAGESRDYTTVFRVLDGADQIAQAEHRITAIAKQPDTDYPIPTGNFAKLRDSRP
jgi:Domain of unknown function (DUF4432)